MTARKSEQEKRQPVNVTIPRHMVAKIDAMAKELEVTRSSMLTIMLKKHLNAIEKGEVK